MYVCTYVRSYVCIATYRPCVTMNTYLQIIKTRMFFESLHKKLIKQELRMIVIREKPALCTQNTLFHILVNT